MGAAGVKRIRILVVDDHAIVRAGLRLLLEKLPYVGAMMEASNGREAIELVASQRPDIVLMDISLSELNGLESTARLVKEFPQTRVIILSAHSSPDFITKALRAGASGYVLKESAPAELDMAISAAMAGGSYLSPTVSAAGINDYVRKAPDEGEPLGALTPRQREILQLIAEGRSTKDIAYVLKVSVKTVETHRSQIMERLEIRDVPGLVRFAIRTGLVSLEA